MISQALKRFLDEHQTDNLQQLALQAKRFPDVDMPFALQQLKGRQVAKAKIPAWAECGEICYPRQLSLEQCSSEQTARFKADLLPAGDTFIDLTGGLGVDFYFIAQHFKRKIYVEQQADLVAIAHHNFATLGMETETHCCDSISFLQNIDNKVDVIYIDPARRNADGRKTVLLADCTPDLTQIDDLLNVKSERTLIKLSPMLDITATVKALSHISQVYVLSVDNEVKELLLLKQPTTGDVKIHAVNICKNSDVQNFTFTNLQESEAKPTLTSEVQTYLYEPNASLLKAGAFRILSEHFSVAKLHPHTHLYTSSKPIEGFPGRSFRVEQVFTFAKNDVKKLRLMAPKVNIATRNFPASPNDLYKKLNLKDGGHYFLFATTLFNGDKVLILTTKADF